MLAIILGGVYDSNNKGTVWGIPASPVDKMWGVFASMGNIKWVTFGLMKRGQS